MATVCKLCENKIGFFGGFYDVAGLSVCHKCYPKYEIVLNSVADPEIFKTKMAEFQKVFSGREGLERIVEHLEKLHETKIHEIELTTDEIKEEPERREDIEIKETVISKVNSNIGPFENQELVYKIDGVRGRHIDIYTDKAVITTKLTFGSLLAQNVTDGEKTIYFSDCIGVQFKQSKLAIGYLQLETASSNGNHKNSNFFDENSFTFDPSVISNERMEEVADYVKSRIDAIKRGKSTSPITVNSFSVADELLKLKQLLDMGVLSQEEFDIQKNKLLNQ